MHDEYFVQCTRESVIYAVIGPLSSDQSRTLETFKLDDDRVEYAQINYNVMTQNPMPDSSTVEKATNEGK